MTVDQKKKKQPGSKWPKLRYTRAPHSASGGGPRPRLSLCRITCMCVLIVFLLIFVTGSVLLCLTDFFENLIHQGLVFQDGGPMFSGWKNPPLKPLVRVHIYNYTNTLEFLEGLEPKLRVQELGPYTYRETLSRINVKFHDNGTMSYNEERTHEFEPSLSVGTEEDLIVVPNLPLIGAIDKVRDEGFLAQMGLNSVLWISKATPFNHLQAKDFLFGYNNSLYSVAKGVTALSGGGPLPKLGLLSTRSGVNNDTYTVWTGRDDYSLLDVVSLHNGRTALSAWEDADCNRIDGSEGAFFPLEALHRRAPVFLFNAGICRRLKLEFREEVTVMDGIPALRYSPPDNFFSNSVDNPDNACYRHSSYSNHLPSGVFNNSPCSYGSPTFLSFPRFYLGDSKLREVVDGIDAPDPEKHQLFFDIHPVLGMNLGAVSRMQINIMIRHASMISHLNRFEDETILPVAWIETVANQFPADTQRAVYHATFTLRAVEHGMMYAFPVISLIFALILACLVLPCGQKKPPPMEIPVQVLKLTESGFQVPS